MGEGLEGSCLVRQMRCDGRVCSYQSGLLVNRDIPGMEER